MGKLFFTLKVNFTNKQWCTVYLITTALILLGVFQMAQINQPVQFKVLDIGQGDSLLIQTPEHRNILIDAGYDGLVIDRLSEELGFFDKTIDLFVLSHSHRDHYVGLFEVIEKYQVKQVMITGAHATDFLYQHFLDKIREKNIPILLANSDQDIQIGTNLYLDILFPLRQESVIGQEVDNKNNVSIVMRLMQKTINGWKPLVMLTGDAEIEEEAELLLSGQNLSAAILKAGHHGSHTATSTPFLEAVNPSQVVISAGLDNSFGHPHEETMTKLEDRGIESKVTLEEGTITISF